MAQAGNSRRTTRGFTLIELLAVVIILVAISAIAIPVLTNQARSADNAAVQENIARIGAFVRAGIGTASLAPASPIVGPAQLTTNSGTIQVPAGYTVSYDVATTTFCIEGQHGSSETLYVSQDQPTATAGTCSAGPAPSPTASPTPTPSPSATLTFTNDSTSLGSLGTFVDSTNNTTVTRTAQNTSLSLPANWEYIIVAYPGGTDQVFKSGFASTVGVLTRVTNSNVTIALTSDVAYTITIKYNGKANGIAYQIVAV